MADPSLLPAVDLLCEDGPVLVVNKPGGLLTQAPAGIDCLEARVRQWLLQRAGKTGNIYLGLPHRLDRPASGALILAKHSRAARRLAEQFEGRLVDKRYWAICEGHVPEASGTWRDFLRKIPNVAAAEVVLAEHPEGRQAVLHFRVVARLPQDAQRREGTVLEITLETGRMHQVRVQAASRGFPLWGDEQYGAVTPFGPAADDPRLRWIALHARRLAFRHPMTRLPMAISAPLPEWWQGIAPAPAADAERQHDPERHDLAHQQNEAIKLPQPE